jgi:aconitate hydratase
MPSSLTALILAAHRRNAGSARRSVAPMDDDALRVDHAFIPEVAMPLVLAAWESLGAEQLQVQPTLVGLERSSARGGGSDPAALADRIRRWRSAGAGVAASGAGLGEVLYRDGFAAPGRVVFTAGRPLPPAGVFGGLALTGSEVATACALATGFCLVAEPRVIGVWVGTGTAVSGVCGVDVALELLRRIPPTLREHAVVEFTGPGVSALTMNDRNQIAATLHLAQVFALFPSDELTRQALRAMGREADWRRMEADQNAAYEERFELDLDAVVPAAAPLETLESARSLSESGGIPIARVFVGPLASSEDFTALARLVSVAWEARPPGLAPGVAIILVPGSRGVAAGAEDALQRLVSAGARLLEPGAVPAWSEEGSGLCCGVRAEDLAPGRGRWYVASPESCGRAARTGVLLDASRPEFAAFPVLDVQAALSSGLAPGMILSPELAAHGGSPATLRHGSALENAVRGTVLARLGHRVDAEEILPRGARLEALEGDVSLLAAHALVPLDPGFAARARDQRGGILVAGNALGLGTPRVATALILAELGVRAVLALSLAPLFRDALVEAGVLPLCFATEADYDAVSRGDELEIPGVPEALEPERPLSARNLTQGTQYGLRHGLDARAVALARAGGLLARTRHALDDLREDVK